LNLTSRSDYVGFREKFICPFCGKEKESNHFFDDGKKRILCSVGRKIPNASQLAAYYRKNKENPDELRIHQRILKRAIRGKKVYDKTDLLLSKIKPLLMECLIEYFHQQQQNPVSTK
jgi:hypothetical protein